MSKPPPNAGNDPLLSLSLSAEDYKRKTGPENGKKIKVTSRKKERKRGNRQKEKRAEILKIKKRKRKTK